MQNPIEIEILARQDFNAATLSTDNENFTIKLNGTTTETGFSDGFVKSLIEIGLSVGSNIGCGLAANYLYDKIKNKAENLWINGQKTEINKTHIENHINIHFEQTINTIQSGEDKKSEDGKESDPHQ